MQILHILMYTNSIAKLVRFQEVDVQLKKYKI
jgi:hypothetical protein